MNPTLLGLLVVAAIGIFLCAFLFIGGLLIDTSLARRKAAAAGGRNIPSRILNDLQPVEDLVVDFVRRSPDLAGVLCVLVSIDKPASFARIVHEIRIGWVGPTDLKIAANLVGTALCILFVTGLVRVTREGFAAAEAGHEVQRRIDSALQPVGGATHALSEQQTRDWQAPVALQMDKLTDLKLEKHTNNMNTNNRNIIVTAADHHDLASAIVAAKKIAALPGEMRMLQGKLTHATIVHAGDVPPDLITLNSRAELVDLDTNERLNLMLVFPIDANLEEGRISVLDPLGAAMLGYRVGDEFEWMVPYGLRRLKVTAVRFQPEAALAMAA